MTELDDTLRPLDRLQQQFDELVESLKARCIHFGIDPKKRRVVAMLDLDDDLFLTDDDRETKKFDAEFNKIARGFHQEEKEEKIAERILDLSELERKLADPDEGIL